MTRLPPGPERPKRQGGYRADDGDDQDDMLHLADRVSEALDIGSEPVADGVARPDD